MNEPQYIKTSWSGHKRRQGPNDRYEIQFGPCSRDPYDFNIEARETARLIGQKARDPIRVLMSGGVDSEVVARSFLDAGVPFEARIFRFKGQGLFDIHFAINFCEHQGIPYKIIDFDQHWFIENEAWDYIEAYKIHKPFVAFDLKKWELTDGFPVFGNGDVLLEVHNGEIYSVESGAYSIPWRWQEDTGHEGCYRFLKETPELFLSYLIDSKLDIWRNLVLTMGFNDSRWWKQWIFKHYWPGMLERVKLTGYETIGEDYMALQKACKEKFAPAEDEVWIQDDRMKEILRPNRSY